MAISSEKKLPSQENLLLDYMRRLEKHKEDRKVVHLHLSLLRPMNRREQHIRTATGNLAMGISRFQGFFIDDIMKKLAEVQAEKTRAKSKSRPKPQAQPAAPAPPVEQPAPAQPAAQPAPVPTQPQPAPVPVQPAQQLVPAPAQPQPKPAPKV